MNLQECLLELLHYEKEQSEIDETEFKKLIEEISIQLTGSYKTRFKRLTLVENSKEISQDDIPF